LANGYLHTRSFRRSHSWSCRRWIHKPTCVMALDFLCSHYMVWNSSISPRSVSLMKVCPQFVCSGNVWSCCPETESKVPTKLREHNKIQSANGTANKIHHHNNPTILHSTLSYSSHLTHLTIRTSIRRTNMLFIMSLFIFPPCNFIPLL